VLAECAACAASRPPESAAPLEATQTDVLPISAAHALRVADLPDHHRDPFDRMIVAQATVEGTPLLIAGKALEKYGIELLKI
jgi:PIN domain nuclease of toxin-antitoxin system